MTRTRLDWPKRPRISWDHCFAARRKTWRCKNEPGYSVSVCQLDYCTVYPKWADKLPTRHRTLQAAMRAAEDHRNAD